MSIENHNVLPNVSMELPDTLEGCHVLIRHLSIDVIAELSKQIEKLKQEIASLKERLNTNSSNSSLPPSKSHHKKSTNRPASQRTSGGQPGHRGHYRELLPTEQVSAVVACPPPFQCTCGHPIKRQKGYQRHQVYELPPLQLEVTEYQIGKGHCTACGQRYQGELPTGVTWGITGPRLTSFMSHLVSRYHLSRREVVEFLKEHCHFPVSLGTVFNKQKLVTTALEVPVSALLPCVKASANVNMDETGYARDGKKMWLWVMASSTAAFFSMATSRGKKVLISLMGDFQHILTTDRYAPYNYFDSDCRQLCWAHLKRDFKRLSEKHHAVLARIGKQLLVCEAELFHLWHEFKHQRLRREELLRREQPLRRRVGELLEQGSYTDPALKAARFCKNLLCYFDALWTFLSVEGVEPTNNHAERCLRQSVIWRKKSFGTRSEYGSEFVARSASVVMTCRLQSKSASDFLTEVLQNHFAKTPLPSLVTA